MRLLGTVAILLAGASFSFSQNRSFTGEIMDSPCAAMRTHSRMMQGVGAKDAKECTQKCVHLAGKYALYDPATKTVYQLDDQAKAAGFAGQKVNVRGTYDANSQTIHVASVQTQ